MVSRHNRVIGLFYLLADGLLAVASFALAHWIRSYLVTPRPLYPLSHYLWIVPLAVGIWMGVGIIGGIYHEIREEELLRVFSDPIKVGFIATTLLFALTSALKLEYISRLLLVLYAAFDLAAMIVFRLIARRLSEQLRRTFAGLHYFLLVGSTPEALEIAHII